MESNDIYSPALEVICIPITRQLRADIKYLQAAQEPSTGKRPALQGFWREDDDTDRLYASDGFIGKMLKSPALAPLLQPRTLYTADMTPKYLYLHVIPDVSPTRGMPKVIHATTEHLQKQHTGYTCNVGLLRKVLEGADAKDVCYLMIGEANRQCGFFIWNPGDPATIQTHSAFLMPMTNNNSFIKDNGPALLALNGLTEKEVKDETK